MQKSSIIRAVPPIFACSGAFIGGAYAMGSTPLQAIGAGLFVATASSGILAALYLIRQTGRATRRGV